MVALEVVRDDAEQAPATVELVTRNDLLRDALKNAALFATKDGKRPILSAVQLEWGPIEGPFGLDANTLRLISTDSYRLLIQEIPLGEKVAEVGSFLLERDAAVSFADHLKKSLGTRVPKLEGKWLRFADRDASCSTPIGTLSGRKVEGEFPVWRSLIDGDTIEQGDACSAASFNPAFLKDLCSLIPLGDVSKREHTIMLAPTALKPMRVTVKCEAGSSILAALMPVRHLS